METSKGRKTTKEPEVSISVNDHTGILTLRVPVKNKQGTFDIAEVIFTPKEAIKVGEHLIAGGQMMLPVIEKLQSKRPPSKP